MTMTYAVEKTSKLEEPILPLPVHTRTKITSKSRVKSAVSASDSMSSLKPSRSAIYSRTTDSAFYFNPTASQSASNHSELTRFSMSDDHLALGQIYGPSTPLSINSSGTTQTFRELPPIRPLQSLHSMMEFSHSKARLQSPVKSNERGWNARSEKLRPSPLKLDLTEDRVSEMRTVAVAELQGAHARGSVQVMTQRREPV